MVWVWHRKLNQRRILSNNEDTLKPLTGLMGYDYDDWYTTESALSFDESYCIKDSTRKLTPCPKKRLFLNRISSVIGRARMSAAQAAPEFEYRLQRVPSLGPFEEDQMTGAIIIAWCALMRHGCWCWHPVLKTTSLSSVRRVTYLVENI